MRGGVHQLILPGLGFRILIGFGLSISISFLNLQKLKTNLP